jgi:maltose O-acetyltransferase
MTAYLHAVPLSKLTLDSLASVALLAAVTVTTATKENRKSLGYFRYHLQRSFWFAFYYAFARHLPVSYKYQSLGRASKYLRGLACANLFHKVGKNMNVEQGADFDSGWLVEVGDNSSIGIRCKIPADMKIGKNVMMGPEVMVFGPNHKSDDLSIPIQEQGYEESRPVTIADDVWIGARVIILSGVAVGKGAIIGAGAVVTKDVPPYAVCVGNPARVVRFRNSQESK